MPKDRNLGPQVIDLDLKVLAAIRRLKDYEPRHKDYSVAALDALKSALEEAELEEMHAQNVLTAARDARTAIRRELHTRALGVKDQVKAQYGPDSDELQSLGLKKKSKYLRPALKQAKAS